jgi:hypothetical protein
MWHKLVLPFALLAGVFVHHPSPQQRHIDRAQASLIRITGTEDVPGFGPVPYVCSGFVVAEHRVLTAAHCIGNEMQGDGTATTVLKVDMGLVDLALLGSQTGKAPLALRDSAPRPGDAVVGVGYAWGWTRPMARHGVVVFADYSPDVDQWAAGLFVDGGFIGGMSGGPILDADGFVVGIVQQSNEGTGYGVGALLIRAFLLGT